MHTIIVLHEQLNVVAIVIVYSRWIWDMHADVMLLYMLYLWIMISMKRQKFGKISVNLITIFF